MAGWILSACAQHPRKTIAIMYNYDQEQELFDEYTCAFVEYVREHNEDTVRSDVLALERILDDWEL